MRSFLVILLFALCMPLAAQTTYDELEFELDSTGSAYKPSGKNYVLLKSKKGTGGMAKSPAADAVINAEVSEIVLVFTETETSDLAEREEANKERWENLLNTYPELFQFSTTYKTVCQCRIGGDAETLKATQGFYIYINGEVPRVAEQKVAASPAPAAVAKTEKVEEKKTVEEKKPNTPAPAAPAPAAKVESTPEKEVAVADKTVVKTKEAAPVEKQEVKTEKPVEKSEPEEAAAPEKEVVKESPKKKAVSAKPRRAIDPKACRPPCYGLNDDDLNEFFKTNIPLTKKQRRKAKNWIANVRVQINFDGSVKKVIVTGTEENFNQMVQDASKSMNNWNSAVKGGVSVKSEVRFSLKYDKETKAMKPTDFVFNPRPSAKCKCVSDSEIFGD